MTVESLQAHHTVLVAQRDQLMANFNASLGAIAFCEQMIAEAVAERAAKAASDVPLGWGEEGPPVPLAPEMLPVVHEDEAHACSDQEYCNRFGCNGDCDKLVSAVSA